MKLNEVPFLIFKSILKHIRLLIMINKSYYFKKLEAQEETFFRKILYKK